MKSVTPYSIRLLPNMLASPPVLSSVYGWVTLCNLMISTTHVLSLHPTIPRHVSFFSQHLNDSSVAHNTCVGSIWSTATMKLSNSTYLSIPLRSFCTTTACSPNGKSVRMSTLPFEVNSQHTPSLKGFSPTHLRDVTVTCAHAQRRRVYGLSL